MSAPNSRRTFAAPLDLRDAPETFRSRFWAKVAMGGPDDCWEWIGHRKASGYGQFTVRKGVFMTASRVALALSGVVLTAGIVACHRCDNPPCVNPSHLFPGSQSVNTNDSIAKGRGNRARGESHPHTHLTWDDVRAIRSTPNTYGSSARLARQYGVDQRTIRSIRQGLSWSEEA